MTARTRVVSATSSRCASRNSATTRAARAGSPFIRTGMAAYRTRPAALSAHPWTGRSAPATRAMNAASWSSLAGGG
ncbi:hypothetical protein [Actinomadura madurae]|uniref:hypothetical protein n=1 Tax=Actinomadura madurae TaxID=1993 RepID=UPI0020D251CB|nr:hypothetical protein [Actinomadura madurae]MCQ0020673.1 hypothetical protein [Actinomadura madurae]